MLRVSLYFTFVLFGSINALAQPSFHSNFESSSFHNYIENPSLENELSLFFAADSTYTQAKYDSVYKQLLDYSTLKNFDKNTKTIFFHVQQDFLKSFEEKTTFSSLFNSGKFNCVSASALLSFFLDLNDIIYEIEELPYHVYVKTWQRNNPIILEATDTAFGFLKENKTTLRHYETDSIDSSPIFKEVANYAGNQADHIVVKGQIKLGELAGLAYYNLAVAKANSKKFKEAFHLLEKASLLYDSARIMAFSQFCALQLINLQTTKLENKRKFIAILLNQRRNLSQSN